MVVRKLEGMKFCPLFSEVSKIIYVKIYVKIYVVHICDILHLKRNNKKQNAVNLLIINVFVVNASVLK